MAISEARIEALLDMIAYESSLLRDAGIAWLRFERFTVGSKVTLRAAYTIFEDDGDRIYKIERGYDTKKAIPAERALLAHEMGTLLWEDSRRAIVAALKEQSI